MADLSITAANVLAGASANAEPGTAGEAIVQGKAVYKSSTTKKWMLADSNSGTAEAKIAGGIALNSAAANQPITVLRSGPLTIGATLTPGATYWLSDTPGGICPDADVGAGENACQIGAAISASVLDVAFRNTGVTR